MLDPLTALSLAAAVIQFVDWGSRLLSQSQEIYHSARGATKENVTTAQITSDIKALSKQLKGKETEALRSPTADDIALRELADSCQREAEELLMVLDRLEVGKEATKWESFRRAIKNARKRGKITEIESRLNKIQQQVNSRLLAMMRLVAILSKSLRPLSDFVYIVIRTLPYIYG